LPVEGFDWKSLKEDALIVDVGGGIGSSTLQLIKAYPHLRYVVQDRAKVITDAARVWMFNQK
jgi:MinD-like ATPase involved in chromosome partitioning or flagellar assembly